MARRDRKSPDPEVSGRPGFGGALRQPPAPPLVASAGKTRKPPVRACRPAERAADRPEDEDDAALFLAAVAGVRPMARGDSPARLAPAPPVGAPRAAELEAPDSPSGAESEFVRGEDPDRLEGWLRGLDPKVVRRLRAGEFPHRAELDLHGLALPAAREAVRSFLLRALRARHRCVLIVHGRGRHSPGGRSPLREHLREWLVASPLAAGILAFVPAQPHDGGDGALYVLLRRTRRA